MDVKIFNVRPGEESEKGLDVCLKEENLREQAKYARQLFNTIQAELDNREEDLKDGLSFLDLKNDTLLSYMIDVCNIVLRKVRGQSIEGHQSVERCVEYRVILEKVKAIDQKLAYQLNKLITLPDNAEEDPDHGIDVRNLDIDLENLESDATDDSDQDIDHDTNDDDDDDDDDNDDDDNDDHDDDDHGAAEKVAPYKPPKSRSVAYTEGRRKNYDEFYQEEDQHPQDETRRPEDEDRVRYEEDNYTRLPKNKKLKRPKLKKFKFNK